MRKSSGTYEWVKKRVWILLLVWLMVMHFLYLLGREEGFSEAAKAGLRTLPVHLPLLASVWFSYARQNKKNG